MPDITPKEARLLIDMLLDLFDDYPDSEMRAANWLITPCVALGNRVPMNVISEDEAGYQTIIQVVGRMREGIPL